MLIYMIGMLIFLIYLDLYYHDLLCLLLYYFPHTILYLVICLVCVCRSRLFIECIIAIAYSF